MTHLVFVYGSLLSGLGNHSVIAAGARLGEAITDTTCTMVSLGAFPGVIEGGEQAIAGELYDVSETTLRGLDRLESNGNFYTRSERSVTLTDGRVLTAWIYLLPSDYLDHEIIESGSWRQHLIESPSRTRIPDGSWLARHAETVDEEPELLDGHELMCEGCDTNLACTVAIGMDLCQSCAALFSGDDDEEGRAV